MLRRPACLALAVALAVALAGCSIDGSSPAATPVAAEATTTPKTVSEPSREKLELVPVTPAAPPSPTAKPKPAAPSYDVAAVQRTLTEHKYYVGAIDGKAGPSLRSAVMAFQKVNGLSADGGVGAATLAALAAPKAPTLRASSPSNRVEVDLDKQVLYVVKGGGVSRIMPVSSGNGATYKQKDGSTAQALTPTGWYKIERRIVGERKADLGTLYDPQYFYRGWAIHGSNSVPAVPASHGCVRVTRADGKYLLSAIGNGMSVYLYGGQHVFTAGSSAPGTDNPTGDTAGAAAAPAPAESQPAPSSPPPSSPPPSQSPSPSPSPTPTPTPTSTGEPDPPPLP